MRISILVALFLTALCGASRVAADAPAVHVATSAAVNASPFVDDRAALLGEQENAELAAYLSSLQIPVYVLTLPEAAGDLQALADAELSQRTAKGLIIVISRRPAMWRISKTPKDLLGSLQIQDAGRTQLVPAYHAKNYLKAFKDTARELNRLAGAAPSQVQLSQESLTPKTAENGTVQPNTIRPSLPSQEVFNAVVLCSGLFVMCMVLSWTIKKFRSEPVSLLPSRADSLSLGPFSNLEDKTKWLGQARLQAERSPTPPQWCSHDDNSILNNPVLWILAMDWMTSHNTTSASETRVEVIRSDAPNYTPSTDSSPSSWISDSSSSSSPDTSSYSDSSGAGGTF